MSCAQLLIISFLQRTGTVLVEWILVWPYDFGFCFLGLGFYENFLHSIAPPFFEEDNRQYFEFICTFYSV